MPNDQIVKGQHVSIQLKAKERELRRAMTPAEHKLWQRLRTNRLEGFHFRRQQIISRIISLWH